MSKESFFWKVFFGSGCVTLFNAIRVFVINKLLAVFLSPATFACVGQFLNLMAMGQATSSLALQNGWVSLTAQNKNNKENLLGIWHGGMRITTFASIFTCVLAVIFCFVAPLESILPGIPKRLAQAAILFAMPGIFATNIITISASVMNGLGLIRNWAAINVVSSIWQMLWVAFFLYTGKLSVLSVVATQSIIAAIFATRYASRAGFNFNVIRKSLLDTRKPWISYAVMGIVPMILTPLVLTYIRSSIGTNPILGWNAAGIWQGVWKISEFMASLISAILGVIILPKITSKMCKDDFWKMFYPLLLRIMLISFVVIVFLFFARNLVVMIMLSSNFAGAANYLPIQLIGDFFRAGGWALGLVLVARQETKIFVFAEIFSSLFLAFGSYIGLKYFELQGPMIVYAIENFLYFIILFFILRRLKWNVQ